MNIALCEELRIREVLVEEPVATTEPVLDVVADCVRAIDDDLDGLGGCVLSVERLAGLRALITTAQDAIDAAVEKLAALRDRPLRDVTYELERHGFTVARVR